ncbi:MAG: gamma-glutamyl-phosphate reductase, partial [Campylobacterales bacterium]|nr:gamma-glutamyl-phosphate reductase [Campylobacterales bacterium]
MQEFLAKAKASARVLNALSGAKKNQILLEMAQSLRDNTALIVEQNAIDMQNADTNNLSSALKDRLLLNNDRVDGMAAALEEIA